MDNIFDKIDSTLVQPVSSATGQPIDQVRVLLIFLLQYTLGWFFHFFIYGTTIRHLWNVVIGFSL